MKAAFVHGPMDVRIEEAPLPEAKPGTVVVRVKVCGVCPSGLKLIKAPERMPAEFWMIPGAPGHEVSAEVVEVGKDVRDWAVGDRVVMTGGPTCGRCYYCRRGLFRFCANQSFTNMTHMGFAEYMACRTDELVRIPDGVGYEEASLAEPLACCVGSVEKCRLHAGDTVAVIGSGTMGLLHIQLARAAGARVLAVDPDESRRSAAFGVGAVGAVAPVDVAISSVKALSEDRGADAVIVAAGTVAAVESAFALVGPGGTVLIFAGIWPPGSIALDPNLIHYQQINLTGSVGGLVRDFERALALLASGQVNVKPLITSRHPLEEILAAHQNCEERVGFKNLIVMDNNG